MTWQPFDAADVASAVADALSDGYNPAIPGTSVFKPGLTAPLTINGFPGSTVVAGATGGTRMLNEDALDLYPKAPSARA